MRLNNIVQLLILSVLSTACTLGQTSKSPTIAAARDQKDDSIIWHSETLKIHKLSPHVYVHTSYLTTKDFGKVDCNGMVVVNKAEAVVFDTPADKKSSSELIKYISEKLGAEIKAIIPTHFHEDCVGGIDTFQEHNIPAYANRRTIELLKKKNKVFQKPFEPFDDTFSIEIGNQTVFTQYFGKGHTSDNIIGYFPADQVIFGGCLIKSLSAGKGNLEDASVNDWSATVKRIQETYPQVTIVIPGHGNWGDAGLLEYTRQLFNSQ